MKQGKKRMAFVLAFVMSLSLLNGYVAKAAEAVTVTLRIEQDEATLLAPVSVTLTDEDKNNDFGIGLSTGPDAAQSPLRAYAKYLSGKGVSNADMKNYIIASPSEWGGLYVTGLSSTGDGIGSASTRNASDVYWMYAVNHESGSVSMSEYPLKDNDSIVIYGLWSPWPAAEEILYSAFDRDAYKAENNSVNVTLTGLGTNYDENGTAIPYTKPIADAVMIASPVTDTDSAGQTAAVRANTNEKGEASLSFPESDRDQSYTLTACKYAADGIHSVISRPYAVITVPANKDDSTTAINPDKKPAKVTALKAKVQKSKKAKKTISLTWKKVSGADGYQVWVSAKKKSGYKKAADVKKAAAKIRKKKGTYYIKVRAYIKVNGKKNNGPYSKVCKVKIK